jgi:SAM-dependent methyltransferase
MTKKKQVLHLGCGDTKKSGAIGVDIMKDSAADVIHNLNKFPYPFQDDQFDEIYAINILEHLDNIPKVMEEIYRITKNKARVYITTGHFSGVDSFIDPTHKHFFTSRTLDYFIPGTGLYKFKYSKMAKFKKIKVVLGPDSRNPFLKLILNLINKYQIYYEKRLAFIFPVGVIYYELETMK